MREVLFRGKRIDDGEWFEGYYLHHTLAPPDGEAHYIATQCGYGFMMHGVDPSTVGQFTGLYDKNGRRVFEGDILAFIPENGERLYSVVKYGVFNCTCCHGVYGWYLDGECGDIRDLDTSDGAVLLEVVGDIYDNPELLEVCDD